MQITIAIPDDHIARWLKTTGWTEETGCPLEAQAYADALHKRAGELRAADETLDTEASLQAALREVGEYQPCTAQQMAEWEIEHHFASHAYANVRDSEGSAGVDKVRSDPKFGTVFDPPTFEVKAKGR